MILSVIVPVYNVERYIHRCIDSILNQTFADFELILVDDGSPDNCPAICDAYQAMDSRIIVVHKKNGGLSDARNAGLDIASGEYVSFIDSDDYIHPQMYEFLFYALQSSNADIVQCNLLQFSDVLPEIKPLIWSNKIDVLGRDEYVEQFFPKNRWIVGPTVCNKIYKRKLFARNRFPVGKLFEDSYIQLDILNLAKRVAKISENLYYYYQRPGSIMHSQYNIKWALDMNAICMHNLVFFRNIKSNDQIQYALDEYSTRFCKDKLAVAILYPQYKKEFNNVNKTFKKEYVNMISNSKICELKKVMLVTLFVSPRLAWMICKKWFPECLYEFMR